ALWIGPFAILVLAAAGVVLFFRRRAQEPSSHLGELDPDERSRVARLLRDNANGTKEGGA
ncbi:MAG: cytochrome c-type biogenesis protein CcmH, partial [Dongiaceae bacterium]